MSGPEESYNVKLELSSIVSITHNFSKDKIGTGGYGDVYRAVHNGEVVALKKLQSLKGLDDEEFCNGFRSLRKVCHENVLPLIGYCYESHKGDESMERVLCFKYMPGGSLAKYISDDSCTLDWPTCYKIIKGTCEGLNHLHNRQEMPIFHLNLKPSNIFFDESLTPKIGDLGLSKLVSLTKTHEDEKINGTQGYMPPEYRYDVIVSDKFDVYSLGVIILKIVAGNMGYYEFTHMSPEAFIKSASEKWMKRLQPIPSCSSMEMDILQVSRCTEIAIRCVDIDPQKRPCVLHIFRELEELEAEITKLSEDLILPMGSYPHHIPLQYLKEITNNFNEEQILGRGGFGVVYKGLVQGGQMVAVKKLLQAMPSSEEQFENEVNLLMKLRHTNIVRLLGYCYETKHLHTPHEGKSVFALNTERLLCLECLLKGSLDKYISDASSGLDWHTRWKIIDGISSGLQYLHEQTNVPIVHLDLKPANILLDGNMRPKITDFGLSRLFDQSQTIVTARISGTLGYMPPESFRGIITPKCDIFSLGVIILEIITGNKDYPYDIRKYSEGFTKIELQKWKNRLQKEPEYASLEMDCQQIERCIQIGLICVNNERTKRPTMKKIIDMLQGLESLNWYIHNELSDHDGGPSE